MFHLAVLLAADLADPVTGGAGWAGAGLLGLVLAWLLFKHLPDKDKQLSGLMDRHDASQKELSATFTNALKEVTQHCKDELQELISRGTAG